MMSHLISSENTVNSMRQHKEVILDINQQAEDENVYWYQVLAKL